MKKVILSFIMPFALSICFGQQEKVVEADIKFDLPNGKWTLYNPPQSSNLVIYKRSPLPNSNGQMVIPNISFIIEDVPSNTDLVVYSMDKRNRKPFEVKRMFTSQDKKPIIRHKYAVGYESNYTDKSGRIHSIYVIHLIHRNKGIQAIFDATSDVFSKCNEEFLKVIGSIENISESEEDGVLSTETISTKTK